MSHFETVRNTTKFRKWIMLFLSIVPAVNYYGHILTNSEQTIKVNISKYFIVYALWRLQMAQYV